MRSCNLGTLESFARLPMRETVVRSSVNVGDIENVNVGAGEVNCGGVIVICKIFSVFSDVTR